jgi:hypothetical protein
MVCIVALFGLVTVLATFQKIWPIFSDLLVTLMAAYSQYTGCLILLWLSYTCKMFIKLTTGAEETHRCENEELWRILNSLWPSFWEKFAKFWLLFYEDSGRLWTFFERVIYMPDFSCIFVDLVVENARKLAINDRARFQTKDMQTDYKNAR